VKKQAILDQLWSTVNSIKVRISTRLIKLRKFNSGCSLVYKALLHVLLLSCCLVRTIASHPSKVVGPHTTGHTIPTKCDPVRVGWRVSPTGVSHKVVFLARKRRLDPPAKRNWLVAGVSTTIKLQWRHPPTR
jgi:hypothetical protein